MYHSRMPQLLSLAVALVSVFPAPLFAQSAEEQAVHAALRSLRDNMMTAWQERDLDALLAYVDENVVVTWQNGGINRGHEGIRAFYDEMFGGADAVIASMDSTLEMQELAMLHGADSAVAYGTLHDEVTFSRTLPSATFIGSDTAIALDSHWTAALARKNGRWLVTAFHVSVDMFDNPVLSLATAATRWIMAIFGAIAGLIIAFVVMRFVGAKGRRAEA